MLGALQEGALQSTVTSIQATRTPRHPELYGKHTKNVIPKVLFLCMRHPYNGAPIPIKPPAIREAYKLKPQSHKNSSYLLQSQEFFYLFNLSSGWSDDDRPGCSVWGPGDLGTCEQRGRWPICLLGYTGEGGGRSHETCKIRLLTPEM